MSRPITKDEIINLSNLELNKFLSLMSECEKLNIHNLDFDFSKIEKKEAYWNRNKRISDICWHIVEWQKLLIEFMDSNLQGVKKNFLPEYYNWKTYQNFNDEIYELNKDKNYNEASLLIIKNQKKILDIIDYLTQEELFTKMYYDWTGNSNLASYVISATSSHYLWAEKILKNHIKNNKK